MNVEQTLQEIRTIRNISKVRRKKRKHQTKKDFLIQKNNQTCTYCQNRFKKEELCFIHKNHKLRSGQLFEEQNNRVIACKDCASKKGYMDHYEFIRYIKEEKISRRQEIVENYPTFANKVFSKYNGKCIYCEFEYGHTPKNVKLTIDHKTPISKLGENDEKNLAAACTAHNKEKDSWSPKEYFDYLQRKGRKFAQTKGKI